VCIILNIDLQLHILDLILHILHIVHIEHITFQIVYSAYSVYSADYQILFLFDFCIACLDVCQSTIVYELSESA
jgi:hypothetical protein